MRSPPVGILIVFPVGQRARSRRYKWLTLRQSCSAGISILRHCIIVQVVIIVPWLQSRKKTSAPISFSDKQHSLATSPSLLLTGSVLPSDCGASSDASQKRSIKSKQEEGNKTEWKSTFHYGKWLLGQAC